MSIKRPWEDISLPDEGIARYPTSLPTIDPVPFQHGVFSNNRYGPDANESVVKKQKLEAYDYNSFPQRIPDLGEIPPIRPPSKYFSIEKPCIIINAIPNSDPGYSQHRGSIGSPNFSPKQRAFASGGPAESQDTSNLCVRCRRLTTQSEELDLHGALDSCENCRRNPELAWVTQGIAAGLNANAAKLNQLAETLRSGMLPEQRSIIRVS
jgi:hypothetical protein